MNYAIFFANLAAIFGGLSGGLLVVTALFTFTDIEHDADRKAIANIVKSHFETKRLIIVFLICATYLYTYHSLAK